MSKNKRKKRAAPQLNASQRPNTANEAHASTEPRATPEKRKHGVQRPPGEGLSKNARRARNRRLRAEAAARAQMGNTVNVKAEYEPEVRMPTLYGTNNQTLRLSSGRNGGVSDRMTYHLALDAHTPPTTEKRPFLSFSDNSTLQQFGYNAVITDENRPSWLRHGTSMDSQSNKTPSDATASNGHIDRSTIVSQESCFPPAKTSSNKNMLAGPSTFDRHHKALPGPITSIFTIGNTKMSVPGHPRVNTGFGQPQEPTPGFAHPLWVRVDPQMTANWLPRPEKSLEDLYNEYPEKRLCGMEPDTLDLVAQTIQQIADEAANNWLKSSCPNTRWKDKEVCVKSLYSFNAPQIDYTIMYRAQNLQRMKNSVATLLRHSRAMYRSAKVMTPLTLVHLIDRCISVCHIVNDAKRKVLLEKAKEKIEWLPVGLDCKKLDIYRRAAKELEQHQSRVRNGIVTTGRNTGVEIHEVEILDQALVEFQEHRLEFVIEMFRTLQHLLEATG